MQENVHEWIHHGPQTNPYRVLGLQGKGKEKKVIRLWRPGFTSCHLEVFGKEVEAKKVHSAGFFEYPVLTKVSGEDYRVFHKNGLLAHDPYAFEPSFWGELDLHLIKQGLHYELYNFLGSTLRVHKGIMGVHFAVWAPNARAVSLVGDFNHWDGRVNPMRLVDSSGIWEIFIPGIGEGEKYKYEIFTKEGARKIKADPVAHFSEIRPKNASVVFDVNRFQWKDEKWKAERGRFQEGSVPLNIYEVHLSSWKHTQKEGDNPFLSYREAALELAAYCKEMGYTHVELMGICEHPLDESWGYQVTGYFAPTSRYGTPEDFQFFVDEMHAHEIGVFVDWVPAHFPADEHALIQFDGTCLYEHEDVRKGVHPHWNTLIFNYGRKEVSNFLIASALFWFEKMHVDGLRVDAVASMLYLDYGRAEGQWIPNHLGHNINLEAVEFLKHLNSIVHERCPGVLMIAEESTAYPQVSHPTHQGGLGFDLKWNMGWMNDTLTFFSTDPFFRHYKLSNLTFSMYYAFTERFILVLSHDEVVHGKASLLAKMPGDDWQKFANLRLLLSFMTCMPGKKLIFMGVEIGQWKEWDCKEALPWELLEYDRHKCLQGYVKTLNYFYLQHPALWEIDFHWLGFGWIDHYDEKNVTISYLRKAKTEQLLCVHHFNPETLENYKIPLKKVEKAIEIFNSDREEFGGSGKINSSIHIVKGEDGYIEVTLSPLATLVFEIEFAH